jgi:hypothetical protein
MDLILWIGRHRWLTLSLIVLVIWFRSPHSAPEMQPSAVPASAAAYGTACTPAQGGAMSGGAVCRGFAARGYGAWTWQPE